ncbi:MAG TPA: hypothetical protein VHX66_15175 [Solirubrobacteraceae bacterium]|jgi:hypothetical protein|nr:hypothetical protein [Solirubrobacteraceae bacterium]
MRRTSEDIVVDGGKLTGLSAAGKTANMQILDIVAFNDAASLTRAGACSTRSARWGRCAACLASAPAAS